MGAKNVPAKVLILSQKDDSYFVSFKFQSDMFLKFDEAFVLGERVIENGVYRGGSSGEMLGARMGY